MIILNFRLGQVLSYVNRAGRYGPKINTDCFFPILDKYNFIWSINKSLLVFQTGKAHLFVFTFYYHSSKQCKTALCIS